jgi:short subunit dehydrogenase-like uncharacterized protein
VSARIVVFGATGYTGRLTAERLLDAGARPVLAGRDEARLRALADRLGGDLETLQADAARPGTVFAAVQEGDVLISTVGPFARFGDAAVRAAIAAGATYLDSTGEPQFIRRVFEEFGAPARRAGATLLTAMGYDWVPGALAGGLALHEAGPDATAVDIGYYAFGGSLGGAMSDGTRESLVGAMLGESLAFRDRRVQTVRASGAVRAFTVRGSRRAAVAVGGSEHFALPAAFPQLRDVNVFLGWFGPLSRAVQAGALGASVAVRLPGGRRFLENAGERLAGLARAPEPGTTPGGRSHVVAIASAPDGTRLSEVHLEGVDGYAFTASFLAWAAQRAAAGELTGGSGALGAVEAFGLAGLEAGVAAAGIERVER